MISASEQEAWKVADQIVGVPFEDLFEPRTSRCSSSSSCHEDGAQAALGVGAEDAEPQPVGGRGANRVWGGVVGVAIIGRRPDVEQGALNLGVADGGERCAGGRCCGDSGEASLGAAVLFQVPGHQRLDDSPVVGVEIAHGDEVLGQRPALFERPGLEGPDEPGLVNQAILQSEQTEEEIAIGIGGGHNTVSPTSYDARGRRDSDVGVPPGP